MQIENLIKGKSVLMIPVYSTRSYETGIYNLLADGNISKFLMKIMQSEAKEIDILVPNNNTGLEQIKNITKQKANWIPFDYGINAHETRNMGEHFYKYIVCNVKRYDYIISEIDTLAKISITSSNSLCNLDNFIYWVGSWNADGTPWYAKGHESINKNIAEKILTACLLPGQVDLYGGKSFYDKCIYNPEYFDKKTIYFPFRLSDNSYHAKEFLKVIQELKSEGYDNFIVLFSDVNDSHIFDEYQTETFVKVPPNRFVYQSILKGKPIIPYFDDIDKNYHSNIFEFEYYGCDVIQTNVFSELKRQIKLRLE